jgi:hypothetical protein
MEVPSILYQISLTRVGSISREKTKTFPHDNSSTLHTPTVNPSGMLHSLGGSNRILYINDTTPQQCYLPLRLLTMVVSVPI